VAFYSSFIPLFFAAFPENTKEELVRARARKLRFHGLLALLFVRDEEMLRAFVAKLRDMGIPALLDAATPEEVAYIRILDPPR
jgi:hypothetical protein